MSTDYSTKMEPAVLMLSTIHSSHAKHSGYGRLVEYVADAEPIHAPRSDGTGLGRMLARIARRFSYTRWFLGGSGLLELRAWRRLRGGFRGIVHSLWADHDLGFLDKIVSNPQRRFVATFHQCPDDLPKTIRFPKRAQDWAAIVLMSECQRPFFLEAGVANERIHVVLHGVDTEYFRPPAAAPAKFTVLSAGGFRRNFPLLREVCELLPDVSFEIVSPPAFRAMFDSLLNVQFHSGLDDAALLAKYQSASCLLHTAEAATANNVLLEAMACGVPIVAERVGGIPEYTTPGCAILTVPLDASALVESIRRLANDNTLRASMSTAARSRAEDLSWPRVARRMEALYASLG